MLPDLRKYYREPLYRNSLSIILTQVFATFFALAFWMVAARTMSSTTVGLATAAFSSTVLLISLAPLGLDAGLTRFLPGSNNKRGLYSTTMLITLLSSLTLMTIFLSGLQVLSPQLVFLREGWSLVTLIGFAAVTGSLYNASHCTHCGEARASLFHSKYYPRFTSSIDNCFRFTRDLRRLSIVGHRIFSDSTLWHRCALLLWTIDEVGD